MKQLDRFLNESRSNGGRRCQMCDTPAKQTARQVERACLEFSSRRAEGQTTLPWLAFHRLFLAKNYRLPVRDWRSIRRHLEVCRGKTLA